jgi:hypothetical protein
VRSRSFGIFGEPWVNLLALNLALLRSCRPRAPHARDVAGSDKERRAFEVVETAAMWDVIMLALVAVAFLCAGAYANACARLLSSSSKTARPPDARP